MCVRTRACLNIKFHQNPSSGSRVVSCRLTDERTDGQTDMTKLIVAFCNYENVPISQFPSLAIIATNTPGVQ
jgi:hypothetical protein